MTSEEYRNANSRARKKRRRTGARLERDEQADLFEWQEMAAHSDPRFNLLFAIPNGQMRKGQPMEPGIMAGVPDVLLAVPVGKYHGLFMELKKADRSNKPTPAQAMWIARLRAAGYAVVVCYGAGEAIDTATRYLKGQPIDG